jgi:hypothetical protein
MEDLFAPPTRRELVWTVAGVAVVLAAAQLLIAHA